MRRSRVFSLAAIVLLVLVLDTSGLAATSTMAEQAPPIPTATPNPTKVPTPSPTATAPASNVLLEVDFDSAPLGPYTNTELVQDWPSISWSNGVTDRRVSVVAVREAQRSLGVLYPAGSVGPNQGGAQWLVVFEPYEELYVAYDVMFKDGFDFVRGGKLPGLVGGEANTGGHPPNGTDGWSARIMWIGEGRIIQYVYHPDQAGTYGDVLPWMIGSNQATFRPGRWHTLETRVVMNTPAPPEQTGLSDGCIQSWLDGTLVLDRCDLRFRDTAELAIDGFYFSTFFGGSEESWKARKDEHIYFDNFVISTEPITHGSK